MNYRFNRPKSLHRLLRRFPQSGGAGDSDEEEEVAAIMGVIQTQTTQEPGPVLTTTQNNSRASYEGIVDIGGQKFELFNTNNTPTFLGFYTLDQFTTEFKDKYKKEDESYYRLGHIERLFLKYMPFNPFSIIHLFPSIMIYFDTKKDHDDLIRILKQRKKYLQESDIYLHGTSLIDENYSAIVDRLSYFITRLEGEQDVTWTLSTNDSNCDNYLTQLDNALDGDDNKKIELLLQFAWFLSNRNHRKIADEDTKCKWAKAINAIKDSSILADVDDHKTDSSIQTHIRDILDAMRVHSNSTVLNPTPPTPPQLQLPTPPTPPLTPPQLQLQLQQQQKYLENIMNYVEEIKKTSTQWHIAPIEESPLDNATIDQKITHYQKYAIEILQALEKKRLESVQKIETNILEKKYKDNSNLNMMVVEEKKRHEEEKQKLQQRHEEEKKIIPPPLQVMYDKLRILDIKLQELKKQQQKQSRIINIYPIEFVINHEFDPSADGSADGSKTYKGDFKKLILDYKDNSLFIYNENFTDYRSGILAVGDGNGFLREYRKDNNNNLKNAVSSLGVPTGFKEKEEKINTEETTKITDTKYNDKFIYINDMAINDVNLTVNKVFNTSISNIYNYVRDHHEIENIFYSAEGENNDQLGLNIFNEKPWTMKNIKAIRKIFNELIVKLKNLSTSINHLLLGGSRQPNSEFDNLLKSTLVSLFNHFENEFASAFHLLEMKAPRPNLMPELLNLLQITNKVKNGGKYGVYRFDNDDGVSRKLLSFINSQFTNTKEYIETIHGKDNKIQVYQELHNLPEVDMTNDTNNNDTKGHIQFFIVAHNLILPKTYTGLTLEFYNDISHFFKKNTLYMSYNEVITINTSNTSSISSLTEIPLTTYDIDFQTGKSTQLPYFTNDASKIYLHDIVKFKKYMTYNHLELAVSIFIGLKEMISK
jgi:hypothetical protein